MEVKIVPKQYGMKLRCYWNILWEHLGTPLVMGIKNKKTPLFPKDCHIFLRMMAARVFLLLTKRKNEKF
jgi:hypothetical protein